jgi:hypothetical protein
MSTRKEEIEAQADALNEALSAVEDALERFAVPASVPMQLHQLAWKKLGRDWALIVEMGGGIEFLLVDESSLLTRITAAGHLGALVEALFKAEADTLERLGAAVTSTTTLAKHLDAGLPPCPVCGRYDFPHLHDGTEPEVKTEPCAVCGSRAAECVHDRPCPACGAPPGAQCLKSPGREPGAEPVHSERRANYYPGPVVRS